MENKNHQLTPNGFIKTMSILHLALLSGILIFGVFVWLQTENWKFNWNNTDDPFFFLVPILSISGIILGNVMYKKQIEGLMSKNSLKEKLTGFQRASIIRYALIEGPAFLGIIAFMNSRNLLYILIVGVLIVYFYIQKPSRESIKNDLNLNSELKNQFNKSEQVIIKKTSWNNTYLNFVLNLYVCMNHRRK